MGRQFLPDSGYGPGEVVAFGHHCPQALYGIPSTMTASAA